MSKRKRKDIGWGPIAFFVAFCIAATIFGIWVNGNIYLRVNTPEAEQPKGPP